MFNDHGNITESVLAVFDWIAFLLAVTGILIKFQYFTKSAFEM